jgi:archaetidylinositol phosphate synthase
MAQPQFAGATKLNDSVLAPLERRLAPALIRRVPAWLETYHLTMLTLVWSLLIVACCVLARQDLRWLWGVSIMIALQWLTDHLDGKVGKHRGTGLVRWGYYMDHLLDYVFLCALLVGYGVLLPESSGFEMLLLLAVFGGFMVHSFLEFAATERFRISVMKVGPTEFRLALIAINMLIMRAGTEAMARALPTSPAAGWSPCA